MEITLKFYKPEKRMPTRLKKSNTSDNLLVKTKGCSYYDFAHYDFETRKWEDAASYHDFYGFQELEDVEMWAQIPPAK